MLFVKRLIKDKEMKKYKAIIYDIDGTLLIWNIPKSFEIEVNGEKITQGN